MTNRLATNGTQAIVWRWEGEAFGNRPAEELAGIQINMRFPGQYYDQETNLHYNYFRYYDPVLGRYITSDPIGLQGGLSTYGYAGQNPVRFVDPYGLTATCPAIAPWGDPNWRPYVSSSFLILRFLKFLGAVYFHCSFYGFLEVRNDECDNSPIGECFYDENGSLVDEHHTYAGCGGTPNEYGGIDPRHIYPDSGGLVRSGPMGFTTSNIHRALNSFR
jgi:RHS repeat-associated protein